MINSFMLGLRQFVSDDDIRRGNISEEISFEEDPEESRRKSSLLSLLWRMEYQNF